MSDDPQNNQNQPTPAGPNMDITGDPTGTSLNAGGGPDGRMPSLGPETPDSGPAWKRWLSGFGVKLRGLAETVHTKGAAWSQDKMERWKIREKIVQALPQDLAHTLPRSFEPYALLDWAGQAFQKDAVSFYGKGLTIVLVTYFTADMTALLLERVIPDPPPARAVRYGSAAPRMTKHLENYEVIMARNLFQSADSSGGGAPKPEDDFNAPPQKTSLPFNLIGTVILRNEVKSVATIEDKGSQTVYPVRMEDEIPSKAIILKIEPTRVIFKNMANGRREYVELPEEAVSNTRISVDPPKSAIRGIEKQGDGRYSVSRATVDKALTDLNVVLTQARALPNIENGVPAGYKLFQIVPNSIFDLLGLKNGDVISGLNGQPVNDPGKAFELLGELRTAKSLDLQIKRNGKQLSNSYDIR